MARDALMQRRLGRSRSQGSEAHQQAWVPPLGRWVGLGMCVNFSHGSIDDSLCMKPATWQSRKHWVNGTRSQLWTDAGDTVKRVEGR